MKTTLPATKVRTSFFKLIEQTNHPGRTLTITVEGEPKVIMMPVADFEGWQETLEIMSDKKLMKAIQEGRKGKKLYTEKEVKKELGLL